jgi:putative transposase
MDASLIAEMSMQNDLLKEALEKAVRPSRRWEMAMNAVARKGGSIALAFRAFEINETCYRYTVNKTPIGPNDAGRMAAPN